MADSLLASYSKSQLVKTSILFLSRTSSWHEENNLKICGPFHILNLFVFSIAGQYCCKAVLFGMWQYHICNNERASSNTQNRNFLDMDSLLKVEELVGLPSRPYWTISFYSYKAYHYYRTGYY
jgi:hypothetical protein